MKADMHNITLKDPFTSVDGAREISEISLRKKITMGDLECSADGRNTVAQDLALLVELSDNLAPDDARLISPTDYLTQIGPFLKTLFPDAPADKKSVKR